MATPPSAQPLPPLQQRFKGCSNISAYQILSKLGEGTFGEVHKARSLKSNKIFALKKILMHNEKDGFPVTAIREIKLLKSLSHTNVLRLEEMAIERPKSKDRKLKAIMYMVTPYMEHDLSGLLTNQDVRFTEPQIKCYMLQLLEGLRYLHNSHILHRDMKAANLLISNRGILQIADFGLARHYDEPVPQKGRPGGEARRDYTALVVTRWYRPPELLLSLRRYTPAIDLWGVGCVFGEMFKRTPILQGQSDLAQLEMIFNLVGPPTDESMPGWNNLPGCDGVFRNFEPAVPALPQRSREWGVPHPALSLLTELLRLDWRKRITAIDALDHPYFNTNPLPAKPADIPKFEDSHELDHRRSKGRGGALPPAPAGGTVGIGPNVGAEWAGPNAAAAGGFSGPASRPPSRNDRSRAPSQHNQDSRKPPTSAAAPGSGPGAGRPGWARETHELPPRPAKSADVQNKSQQHSAGGARPAKDTYIPSYSNDSQPRREPEGQDRDDRDSKDKDRRPARDRDRPRERDVSYRERDRETDRNRDRGGRGERGRVEIDRYTPGDRDREKPRERERDKGWQNGQDYTGARDRPRERDRGRDSPSSTSGLNRNRKRTRSPSADENSRERKSRDRSHDHDRDRERDRDRDWDKHNNREREGLDIFGRR